MVDCRPDHAYQFFRRYHDMDNIFSFLVDDSATDVDEEFRKHTFVNDLFLELNDLGLIQDGTEFDIEKMRKLLETASLEKTKD